jgi:hypothetical protein
MLFHQNQFHYEIQDDALRFFEMFGYFHLQLLEPQCHGLTVLSKVGFNPPPLRMDSTKLSVWVDDPIYGISARANVAKFTGKYERFATAFFKKSFVSVWHSAYGTCRER